MSTLTVGIVGWHHATPGLFEQVARAMRQANLTGRIHLLNHRPSAEVPPSTLAAAERAGVIVHHFENVGFDWGAYSQFLTACGDELRAGEHVLWMHDDVELRDPGVFARCIELTARHAVVGHQNALVPGGRPWGRTHPAFTYWLERTFGQRIEIERWNTVRGSFVFMRAEVLRRVPVVPHRQGKTVRYGNWGLILWAGLVTQAFGPDAIGALIDTPGASLESRWLRELFRGGEVAVDPTFDLHADPAVPAWKRLYRGARAVARTLRDWPPEPPEIEGLKVHVGSGFKPIIRPDTLNVDAAGDPDLEIPFDQLAFDPGSLAEVSSHHFIEHLTKQDGRAFIERAFRWLKPGGRFVVECPDVAKVARHVIRLRAQLDELETGPYGLRGLFGEPTEGMTFWDHHKWGYTEASMTEILRRAGFRQVSSHRPVSHGRRRNRDLRVIGVK